MELGLGLVGVLLATAALRAGIRWYQAKALPDIGHESSDGSAPTQDNAPLNQPPTGPATRPKAKLPLAVRKALALPTTEGQAKALVRLVSDRRGRRLTRRRAFFALIRSRDVDLRPIMGKWLDSSDDYVRNLVFGFAVRKRTSRRKFADLIARVPGEMKISLTKKERVRAGELAALIRFVGRSDLRSYEPFVAALLNHRSRQVTAEVIDYLARLGTPQTIPVLQAYAGLRQWGFFNSEPKKAALAAIDQIRQRANALVGGLSLAPATGDAGALSIFELS